MRLLLSKLTGRFGAIPVWSPGRFGPIPFRSGRFSPFSVGHFGPLYFIPFLGNEMFFLAGPIDFMQF